MNNHHENKGYNFEDQERFSWNQPLKPEYQDLQQGLTNLKQQCQYFSLHSDQDSRILFQMMGNVLEGLERAFEHHFSYSSGQEISPKSDEPWD